jgi:hypothetical protein
VQSIVAGVRSRVLEGRSLAAGLAEFPQVFDELYRATVAAGEQSGHLDPVLERLADYTEIARSCSRKSRMRWSSGTADRSLRRSSASCSATLCRGRACSSRHRSCRC